MLTSLKQFSIIPNIHPIFVHFTIATVSISFIFHIFYLLGSYRYKRSTLVSELGIVARWCLWLAGLFSILTVLAGLHAYYTVLHDEAGHLAMQTHRNSAIISFVLILLATTISIGQYRRKSEPNHLLLLILFITQISVLTTGYLGGEVVYRYGISVIKAQTSDMQLSHNHHHDNKTSEQSANQKMNGMDMSKMDMGHDHENNDKTNEDKTQNTPNNKAPIYWIDPMEPNVHYAKPGKSAMGMELVPVYSKPKDDNQPKNSIKLPQGYVNNLGVVTVPVVSSNLANQISTYAYVEI
ncbi:MAG: DUF2231 domain-containing protein [Legionella longbeachae]|nr:DUF2231 domain-containing protein [Legionella longbeachae]